MMKRFFGSEREGRQTRGPGFAKKLKMWKKSCSVVTQTRNVILTRSGVVISSRLTHTNSWAAKALSGKGEKLTISEMEPLLVISNDILKKPSDKVIRLADEILGLNSLESLALFRGIQVNSLQF
jgi:hypothetical protein